MDKRIRKILRANENWTCDKSEDKLLAHLGPNSGMGEKKRTEKKEEEKRESFREREIPYSP